MKKSYLFFITAVILLSCEKSADTEVVAVQNQEVVQKEPIEWPDRLNRVLRIDWPNQGDAWCGKPRMDCWDDVVVIGKSDVLSVYQDFIESQRTDNLIPFFSGETYKVLFPYLSSEIRDNILRKEYSVSLRKNSKEKNTQIVVIQDQESTVIAAYPLNIQ